MKGSEFVFDYVQLLYYKCHKVNANRFGSYIDSPNWIKNKKATINPINKKDNKCFQYTVTVALNYVSKHSSDSHKQVILLMIPNGKKSNKKTNLNHIKKYVKIKIFVAI